MKGKVLSVKERQFEGKQGGMVTVFDVIVDIGDDKKRKYSTFQKEAKELKEGQEVTYEEKDEGEWTDNEGMTHKKWKMILPKKEGGGGGGRGYHQPDPLTMLFAYAKDIVVAEIVAKQGKLPVDAATLTIEAFRRFAVAYRAELKGEEPKEETKKEKPPKPKPAEEYTGQPEPF